jgi:hypothetical protein
MYHQKLCASITRGGPTGAPPIMEHFSASGGASNVPACSKSNTELFALDLDEWIALGVLAAFEAGAGRAINSPNLMQRLSDTLRERISGPVGDE